MDRPDDFIEQFFEATLRIILIEAHDSYCTRYDSGWLPC